MQQIKMSFLLADWSRRPNSPKLVNLTSGKAELFPMEWFAIELLLIELLLIELLLIDLVVI